MKHKTVLLVSLIAAVFAVNDAQGQSQPAGTSQVGPGDTGSIDHGKKAPAPDRPHHLLDDALTPQTRERLQKAMDANPPAPPAH